MDSENVESENMEFDNMESEGRPAKMRKLEHVEEKDGEAVTENAVSLTSNIEAQSITPVKEQQQARAATAPAAAAEPGEEIIGTFLAPETNDAAPKLSKNALKKQRKLERWEAGRDDRKLIRKQKIQEKKGRRREEVAAQRANGEEPVRNPRPRHTEGFGRQVPVTVIFDCDFDDLMVDNELKSLGLQLTRCYSDNRKAAYRVHMGVSSFGGKLKERFDGILARQYENWKGVKFREEDFVAVSEMARGWMAGPKGGVAAGALRKEGDEDVAKEGEGVEKEGGDVQSEEEGEVVYLSAESDNTLERLKPNSTYIIGGLVDKNRHKGICYKRAMERGIKTAKLPIGEFLQMKSRQVLTTNHVMEIMLRWLEFDDWGKAFITVLPERKGAVLKGEVEQEEDAVKEETREE